MSRFRYIYFNYQNVQRPTWVALDATPGSLGGTRVPGYMILNVRVWLWTFRRSRTEQNFFKMEVKRHFVALWL
jgi:hypothetical protein